LLKTLKTTEYIERVYAGVLGKIIGIYLGRPFENWPYERIMSELGEINYYVNDKVDLPLVVTDDDIAGTFTFLRALSDYGNSKDISISQIGQTWLNYLIENRTIIWWGGLGTSTEHTAYLRLKNGIKAPQSGSISTNGKTVAEQIGAQIFIDGWAMVAPGEPDLASELALKAASVSHDGEALYAAQVIAAMESQAFIEKDINRLIDMGLSFIPNDSKIYRMINDLRDWRVREEDWRAARKSLDKKYGYSNFEGICPVVPNHGLIILSLLYGEDDFQKTLMIVNTSGWDTDCNSGNVGCLMGIKNGLAGIDSGPDWRGPVADKLYLSTSEGGRAITDAVRETHFIVNTARALKGETEILPKNGARFHFDLPGAVQGFEVEDSIDTSSSVSIKNIPGHSKEGNRSLAIRFSHIARGQAARVITSTFICPKEINMPGYELMASPTLYSGQTIRMGISADEKNLNKTSIRLFIHTYGAEDKLNITYSPKLEIEPDTYRELNWKIDDTGGCPIAQIGLEIEGESRTDGILYLDYLTWDGAPDVVLTRPAAGGRMWRRAWVLFRASDCM